MSGNRPLRITAFVVALAASAIAPGAAAQFAVTYTGTPPGPATCTTTNASAPLVGTIAYILPATSNNLFESIAVNGGTPNVVIQTQSSGSFPASAISISGPSTPLPYTIVGEIAPANNGQPTGLGLRVTIVCPAGGPGTATIAAVSFGTGSSIPTLPAEGLAALSALLALVAARQFRRRRA